MPQVRMSVEEYLDLVERAAQGGKQVVRGTKKVARAVKKARKGTPLKGMKSALQKANAMARKKNGSFKKGWTQARVMKKAHQIRR